MMDKTIKTYQGGDVAVSQCLVTLKGFIGYMADDSTIDASDAVRAVNGLIWTMEQREADLERKDAEITRLRELLRDCCSAADHQQPASKAFTRARRYLETKIAASFSAGG